MTSAPEPYGAADEAPAIPDPATAFETAQPEPAILSRPARTWRSTAIAAVALLVSLSVWGWFATANAREGWWAMGNHVAITPDEDGWAAVGPLSVQLTQVTDEVTVESDAAPDGFRYLELVFGVESAEKESRLSCVVEVLAADGRLFLAGREVPGLGDEYVSELTCGTSDPLEDPVPAAQSMLVLLPVDAEPASVRVDASTFPPASFVELPLP